MQRRTAQDFIELEFMSNSQLREAIELAEDDLMDLQDYLKRIDEEAEEQKGFKSYVPLDLIIDKMTNLEGYIEKAENLISRFENKRYLARADRVKSDDFYSPFKKDLLQSKLNTLRSRRKPLEEPPVAFKGIQLNDGTVRRRR